jgi:hypothetical protein
MATKKSFEGIYIPDGIIRGNVIDSFTLTPANFVAAGKGDLAAQEPLFWDRAFIDLHSKSKLYIFISKNLSGHKVQLSIKLFSFHQNPPKQMGNFEVDFNSGSSSNAVITKISVPYSTPIAEFYAKSPKEYVSDSACIELSFPNYYDVGIQEVKVDIYQDFLIKFK